MSNNKIEKHKEQGIKKEIAIKNKLYLIKRGWSIIQREGVFVFLKKVVKYLLNKIFLNIISKIKILFLRIFFCKALSKTKRFYSVNPEEAFIFAQDFYFGAIEPMQVKEEFVELLKIFKQLNPKYIMEIGTANGGTLFAFSKLAREDATIISVDLPQGQFGGGYSKYKIPLYESFAKKGQRLHLLREDSHKQTTLEEIKHILGENKLDFLFIDGDHTYEGVKRDFEMYNKLVKKGGLIAFHDIVKHPIETNCNVNLLWDQIKKEFKHNEIVKNWKQNWAGIGIIYI